MADLLVFRTADAPSGFLARLRPMLDAAFDGDFDDDDWHHALGGWHAAIVAPGEEVLAHAAVVERALAVADATFRTGFVEAVATAPEARGAGHGVAVMQAVTDLVVGQFEFGALATGSHDFYRRFGWQRWAGPTYVRHDAVVTRTADDDHAVMVLRHGASAAVELTAALTCTWRPGAVW